MELSIIHRGRVLHDTWWWRFRTRFFFLGFPRFWSLRRLFKAKTAINAKQLDDGQSDPMAKQDTQRESLQKTKKMVKIPTVLG